MTTTARISDAFTPTSDASERHLRIEAACADLKHAIDGGGIGDIVSKHEALILHYYQDVQDQAKLSFDTARSAARVGFWVVIGALVYALVFDALNRFGVGSPTEGSMTISKIGLISGALIEFVAAVAFWLYSRGARQFGAFHICLERTHRYLLAYKIAEQIGSERDETFKKIACIMANAPMIARVDADTPSPLNSAVPSMPGIPVS